MSENGGTEVPEETPEADAAEQAAALVDDEEPGWDEAEVPLGVDEGDAAEQRRVVETDEDDYR